METKEWGGIDHETDERCCHGKRPRRLFCWDSKNTGRRYLGCPLRVTPPHFAAYHIVDAQPNLILVPLSCFNLQGKLNMCDFIEWKDDRCPAIFQEVAANIWKVIDNFKKKADDLQAELSVEIQLRKEMYEENEALMGEKTGPGRRRNSSWRRRVSRRCRVGLSCVCLGWWWQPCLELSSSTSDRRSLIFFGIVGSN